MKKISVTLAIGLSVSLIVLSLVLPVNYTLRGFSHGHAILGDGAGLPPTPPPPRNHSNVIVNRIPMLDGAGLPPTPPPPPRP
jgi:hypothetical protein